MTTPTPAHRPAAAAATAASLTRARRRRPGPDGLTYPERAYILRWFEPAQGSAKGRTVSAVSIGAVVREIGLLEAAVDVFPSVETLADVTGLAPGSVRRAIVAAKAQGLLIVSRRTRKSGASSTNSYRLDYTALARTIPAHRLTSMIDRLGAAMGLSARGSDGGEGIPGIPPHTPHTDSATTSPDGSCGGRAGITSGDCEGRAGGGGGDPRDTHEGRAGGGLCSREENSRRRPDVVGSIGPQAPAGDGSGGGSGGGGGGALEGDPLGADLLGRESNPPEVAEAAARALAATEIRSTTRARLARTRGVSAELVKGCATRWAARAKANPALGVGALVSDIEEAARIELRRIASARIDRAVAAQAALDAAARRRADRERAERLATVRGRLLESAPEDWRDLETHELLVEVLVDRLIGMTQTPGDFAVRYYARSRAAIRERALEAAEAAEREGAPLGWTVSEIVAEVLSRTPEHHPDAAADERGAR